MTSFAFWRELVFTILLFGMAFVDLKKRVIPNELLGLAVLNGVAWVIIPNEFNFERFFMFVVSAVIPLCLFMLVLILDEWKGTSVMGGGDIKLLFVMALYADWYQLLLVLLVACVLGLLFAFLLRKKGGDTMAFGPFLAIGYILIKSGFLSARFLV